MTADRWAAVAPLANAVRGPRRDASMSGHPESPAGTMCTRAPRIQDVMLQRALRRLVLSP